jgi:hypothetical protein
MRLTSSVRIGPAIMACLLLCGGCGGSLEDTPDLSKGPSIGAGKLKQMEESKAKVAAEAQAKGKPKGPGRR